MMQTFPPYGTFRNFALNLCSVDAEIGRQQAQTERFLLQLKSKLVRHPSAAGPSLGIAATRVSHESCDMKATVTAGSDLSTHLPSRGQRAFQNSSPVRTTDSQRAAMKQPGGVL